MTRRARRLLGLVATALLLGFALLAVVHLPALAAWRWSLRAGHPLMSSTAPVLEASLHWFDDYYAVADLGQGAFAIGEPRYGQCNFSYLIVGRERALLFDSGPGVRDIRPVVRALTQLPVVALPSHLHFDHVGNLARFADIALPDLPALREQARDGHLRLGRYQHLGYVEGVPAPELAVTRWIAPGETLDLGGRRVTLWSVPGHTPDSVVLRDSQANRLYAGDFIYPAEIYAFLPGADLGDYAASAGRVAAALDPGTIVYGGHGCDQLPSVGLPALGQRDVLALQQALILATQTLAGATAGYPRVLPVNEHMVLWAKYPWMRP